jgi:hypothetical protein
MLIRFTDGQTRPALMRSSVLLIWANQKIGVLRGGATSGPGSEDWADHGRLRREIRSTKSEIRKRFIHLEEEANCYNYDQ